jgi:hypothetical protein
MAADKMDFLAQGVRRVTPLLLFVPLVLSGCGGDGAASAIPPTQSLPGTTLSSLSLQTGPSGLFRFTSPRVSGTVDLNGAKSAQVRLLEVNSGYLIEARLDNGVVLLANTDLDAADRLAMNGLAGGIDAAAPRNWVWVTPISTLFAVYRQVHPSVGQEGQSLQKVKSYLGIGATESINRPFSSVPTSHFSPRVFLQSAGSQGVPAFAASLISEIEAGLVRVFVEPANQSVLGKSLFDLPLFVANPTFKGFVQNIWGGGMTWSLASKGLGFGLGKLLGVIGLHSSTYKQLQAIQNQLTAMTEQLTQMQTQLANIKNQDALETLNNDLSPALTSISGYTNQQLSAMSAAQPPNSFYIPFSCDDNFQSNTNFQAALAGANQDTARSSTITVLADSLGIGSSSSKGNLVTGYIQRLAQLNGSGVNSYSDYATGVNSPFYYDFRSDVAVTQSLTNVTGTYQVAAMLGANMLTESANKNLSSNTQSPVAALTSAQVDINGYKKSQVVGGGLDNNSVLTQNGLAALSKRQLQQQPLGYLGGESPLGNLWGAVNDAEDVAGTPGLGHINGTMWSAIGYELTSSGTTPPSNNQLDIQMIGYYAVNGWDQWYLPSKNEVERLFARARSIARNSDSPPSSDKEIAFGLHQMGLISDQGYQHALNDSGYVEVYYDLEFGSGGQEGFHLQVLRSDGNSYDNGLTTVKDALGVPSVLFKPQNGHLATVLLVRPLPGRPRGAYGYLPGPATTTAPSSVVQSQSAQKLGSGALFWNNDLALACGFVPDEIVIQQDPNNPYQLRAYGLWTVGLSNPPKAYTGNYFLYPGVFASNYLIYTELTDLVEWLTSDTSSVEVSNYPPPGVTMIGANLTGLSGAVSVENVTGTQNSGVLQLAGGELLQASALSGSLSGGSGLNLPGFQGDITQGQSLASPISVEGGQLTGGNLTVTSTNTLLTPADGSQAGFITNGTVSGASLQGALVPVPLNSGNAGLLNVHAANPVTVTASWMYSPSVANGTTNSVGSVALFIPPAANAAPFPYVGETPLALTPPPALSGVASLVLSPNYTTVIGNTTVGGGQIPFFLTSINYDGTYTSLETSANVTFQVFLLSDGQTVKTAPNLFFKTPANGGNQGTQNILSVPPGFTGYVAIKATANGRSTYAFMNLSF